MAEPQEKPPTEPVASEAEVKINEVDDAPASGAKPSAPAGPAKLQIFGPPLQAADGDEDVYLTETTPDEDDLHPLFRNSVPEDLEKYPLFGALQAIQNDSISPEETAEELKARGNAAFNRNDPRFYKVTVEYYTKAIRIVQKLGYPDKDRASLYHTNRAAVSLAQKNYRKTMEDCVEAIALNSKNIKAYWRYSKAAVQINKFEEADKMLKSGLGIEPNNELLLKDLKELKKPWDAYLRKLDQDEKDRVEREAQRNKLTLQRKELYDRIAERGISCGKYQFGSMEEYLKSTKGVYIDSDTKFTHWPVMFIYEEHMQRDFIADMCEEDTFEQHLAEMFPNDAQALPWDTDRKYKQKDLEIYFICHQVYPLVLGKNKKLPTDNSRRRKVKVRQSSNLRKVLLHNEYVVPGFPVFYIVAANSSYKEKFIKIDFDTL